MLDLPFDLISSFSGLDIFIGLPLSENYQVARSEGLGFSSLEDWYALLFDEGWKMVKLALSADSKYSQALRDIKDPPVSKVKPSGSMYKNRFSWILL